MEDNVIKYVESCSTFEYTKISKGDYIKFSSKIISEDDDEAIDYMLDIAEELCTLIKSEFPGTFNTYIVEYADNVVILEIYVI